NGEPAVNADVYLIHWFPTPLKKVAPKPLAKTDREGRFRFTSQPDRYGESAGGTIVAKLDGFGFAWATAPAKELSGESAKRLADAPRRHQEMLQRDRGPMRLLADDAPITGRVVDTEGNGVAGVSVHVSEVLGGVDNTMAAWDEVLNGPNPDDIRLKDALVRKLQGAFVPPLLGETISDDEGRFTIRGVGKHRIVKIVMQRAGIVAESTYARTSGGTTAALPMEAERPDSGFEETYHGNDFTVVAERSKPVVGSVTDEDGKGIAGVVVTSVRSYVQSLEGGKPTARRCGSEHVVAVTDAEGKYRLEGLPISRHNTLRFSAPAGSRYLGAATSVDTRLAQDVSNRYAPATTDFALQSGLVVEGRVLDVDTNAGVIGNVRFIRLSESGGMLTASMSGSHIQRSNADGGFRVVVPKSKGTLTFTAFERHKYRMAKPPKNQEAGEHVKVVDGDVIAFGTSAMAQGHAIHEIRGTESQPLRLDLRVHPANVAAGYAVAPNGDRLDDVFYTGRSARRDYWARSTDGGLELYDVDADLPRRVAVIHRTNEMAGVRTLTTFAGDFTVPLQPWATVRGRIVDPDAEPLAGVRIRSVADRSANQVFASPVAAAQAEAKQSKPLVLPPTDVDGASRHTTDQEGRFEITGLVAGETYHLHGSHSGGGNPLSMLSNTFVRDLTLKPGEARDLGDVVLTKQERDDQTGRTSDAASAAPAPIAVASASPDLGEVATIKGRVSSAETDRPLADARIWKGRVRIDTEESILELAEPDVLAPNGEFAVAMEHFASTNRESTPTDQWLDVALFATAEDHGFAWFTRDDLSQQPTAELELVPDDVPIRGRVVDTEGRPVAGLEVSVESIYASGDGDLGDFLKALEEEPGPLVKHIRERLPRSAPLAHQAGFRNQLGLSTTKTDRDGRFEVGGVGRERLAAVAVSGATIQSETFFVATRDMASKRVSVDARSGAVHGARCTLVVAQGLTIEGVVTDKETQQPLPGVLIRDSTLNNVAGAYR
ncbi:MAG: carboxypeptidase-like regulatory domain-containing protein, partial [Planctomycetota bacterium]